MRFLTLCLDILRRVFQAKIFTAQCPAWCQPADITCWAWSFPCQLLTPEWDVSPFYVGRVQTTWVNQGRLDGRWDCVKEDMKSLGLFPQNAHRTV